jgi:hypothetical protein
VTCNWSNKSNVFSLRLFGAAVAVAVMLTLTAVAVANAPAGRYTISNGTVFDTKTKLTWMQAFAPSTYTLAAALAYCASPTAGPAASLGGTGWRLPTVKEFFTIVDYSQPTAPLIDPTAFPVGGNSVFWTSTPMVGSPSSGWWVNLENGQNSTQANTTTSLVRCVR